MNLLVRRCDNASTAQALDIAYKNCASDVRLLYDDVGLPWRIAIRAGSDRESHRCMTQRKGQK
ncbi:MAG: hypothetical protein OXI34_12540 [Chloroflexota bacterium]|nr:hypothetical protein [Chloroflexota bacterium]MDE2854176.1 hypothetical protein [Chloroflexota bacterium]MDE2948529.1 hypothetical protein [Chloroflexota bacterium]